MVTFSTHYMRAGGNNGVIPSSLLLHCNLSSNYLWQMHKAERSHPSILLVLSLWWKTKSKIHSDKTETIWHQVAIHSWTFFSWLQLTFFKAPWNIVELKAFSIDSFAMTTAWRRFQNNFMIQFLCCAILFSCNCGACGKKNIKVPAPLRYIVCGNNNHLFLCWSLLHSRSDLDSAL